MVVIEYLKHWWLKRPRRLDTGKEAGSQPTFQATYLELCEVLGLKRRPAVYVEGNVFETYPIVHQLRKKHIPVLTMMEKDGQKLIIQIPSGS